MDSKGSRFEYHGKFFVSWTVKCTYSSTLPLWWAWRRGWIPGLSVPEVTGARASAPAGSLVSAERPRADASAERAHLRRLALHSLWIALVISGCGYTYYASLDHTSVSANTTIYNSGCMFVFLLSWLFLGERASLFKVAALLVCAGGVALVSFSGTRDNEQGVEQTVGGYLLVLVSTLLWAVYEVAYKVVSKRGNVVHLPLKMTLESPSREAAHENTQHALDALFFLGCVGVSNALTQWPVLLVLNATGSETWRAPGPDVRLLILAIAGIDIALNVFLLIAIAFSDPTVVSVATLFTVPGSMLADLIVHHYLAAPLGLLGIALIALGFAGLTLANRALRLADEQGRAADAASDDADVPIVEQSRVMAH